jgi:hypothetical protein
MIPTHAQDAEKSKQEAVSTKPFRRVPPYFSKAGISSDQKEKIYIIRGKYQPRIEALQKQIAEIQAQELAECESILLEPQKKVLDQLRSEGQSKSKSKAVPATTEATDSKPDK